MHKPTALGLLQEWDFTRMCQVWPAKVVWASHPMMRVSGMSKTA